MFSIATQVASRMGTPIPRLQLYFRLIIPEPGT